MSQVSATTMIMGYLGMLLLPAGVAVMVVVYALDNDSWPRVKWREHVANLQVQLDELFLVTRASTSRAYSSAHASGSLRSARLHGSRWSCSSCW
ncbi:MAG: hypothetical protein R3A78_01735 [Polyangiales bacterium]